MIGLRIVSACLVLCATEASACDIALVLAVDVSGSVDAHDYTLQSRGLADALGDPVVAEALVKTRAVVTVLHWSGEPHQNVVVPWVAIDSHADVGRLRRAVIAAPRAFRIYSTGIGEAIRVGASLFSSAPRQCKRRIIDVSGDGPSNEGIEPQAVRALLDAEGISVNGLAIEGSEEGIAAYYRAHVIHGPGAFVEVAKGFDDFPRAIRRKLLRELAERVASK